MDVSHLIDHSDEGQDAHDAMHPDQLMHIARAFAHKAGVGKDPGQMPPDFETPSDQEGQEQMHQAQAIDNLAAGGPANVTAPTPKPLSQSTKPDFSSL
jgi:hypothetical protein